mmetsp:Transcript_34840/g.113731  ORF Transcript_34840/g.113731 Transcript_34840/m.113731 type:complete len:266 (-) Transcript_34840:8-805(-)
MPSSAPNVRRTPPRAPAAPAHARRADLLARLFSCRIPDPVVARWLSVSLRVWVCLCAVGTGVWGCRYCRGFSHEHIFVAATLPIQHDAPATHHTHPKVQEKCSAGSAQKGKQTQPVCAPRARARDPRTRAVLGSGGGRSGARAKGAVSGGSLGLDVVRVAGAGVRVGQRESGALRARLVHLAALLHGFWHVAREALLPRVGLPDRIGGQRRRGGSKGGGEGAGDGGAPRRDGVALRESQRGGGASEQGEHGRDARLTRIAVPRWW